MNGSEHFSSDNKMFPFPAPFKIAVAGSQFASNVSLIQSHLRRESYDEIWIGYQRKLTSRRFPPPDVFSGVATGKVTMFDCADEEGVDSLISVLKRREQREQREQSKSLLVLADYCWRFCGELDVLALAMNIPGISVIVETYNLESFLLPGEINRLNAIILAGDVNFHWAKRHPRIIFAPVQLASIYETAVAGSHSALPVCFDFTAGGKTKMYLGLDKPLDPVSLLRQDDIDSAIASFEEFLLVCAQVDVFSLWCVGKTKQQQSIVYHHRVAVAKKCNR